MGIGGGAAADKTRLGNLDLDGIARVGDRVSNGAILVNKEVPKNTSDTISNPTALEDADYKAMPMGFKAPQGSSNYVDQVCITSNETDLFVIKIKMRSLRRPELGDKFSSRHGQKGVTGLIVHGEDFPFNDQVLIQSRSVI